MKKSNQYFQNLLTDFPGFSFPSLTPIEKEGFETINKNTHSRYESH